MKIAPMQVLSKYLWKIQLFLKQWDWIQAIKTAKFAAYKAFKPYSIG